MDNEKREASRHFRNKRTGYLKGKINELATNSKNKNIRGLYRGINGFRSGYHCRSNIAQDGNNDLLADSHNINTRRRKYCSQLLNVDIYTLRVST
jgi:hypothetical protein